MRQHQHRCYETCAPPWASEWTIFLICARGRRRIFVFRWLPAWWPCLLDQPRHNDLNLPTFTRHDPPAPRLAEALLMCLGEPPHLIIILKDDDLSGIAAKHDGIPVSLSKLQITPWYLNATAVRMTQKSYSTFSNYSLPLSRCMLTDRRWSRARSIWSSPAPLTVPLGM